MLNSRAIKSTAEYCAEDIELAGPARIVLAEGGIAEHDTVSLCVLLLRFWGWVFWR